MATHFLSARLEPATGPIPADALPVRVGTFQQGVSVQATCGVFLALSWITVMLRLYTRGVLVHNIGSDDWWILLAVIFFTVYNVACIVCAGVTMGDVYLRIPHVDLAFDTLMVAESFYVVTMCALKISVSIFFLRVMVKPWQRWLVYISLFLATAVNLAYFFVIVFQCGVPRGGMEFLMKQLAQKCLKKEEFLAASYIHGVVTTITDVGFAVLPVTVLKESKLRLRERITVVGILSLAAIGGVASMVRLNYIPRLATATQTWFMDANLIAIWSAVEPGLGIMASSLATLRPLFRGCFNFGNTQNSSSLNGGLAMQYARFPSFKNGTMVEELPARGKIDDGEGTPYDSFEFIQGGLPALKGTPVGPHEHIQKEPWRPSGASERRAPGSRMGKAEELLGEDLSTFARSVERTQPSPAPLVRSSQERMRARPPLGNTVSCEGPRENIRADEPEIRRCGSKCRLHGYRKG